MAEAAIQHNNNIVLQMDSMLMNPAHYDDQNMRSEAAEATSKHMTTVSNSLIKVPQKYSLLQKAVAELMGTFFIVFAGCASCIVVADIGHASAAIGAGMAVILMIFVTGHISAAHLNPAVSLGFAMAGRFPWKQVIPYIISQTIGSLLASLILQVLVPDATRFSLVISKPLHHNSESLVMEIVATFILMLVNMKVSCSLGQIGELGGILMIGMTVALLGFYAGPLCGGVSMNPARSIGPALVTMQIRSLYIFIIGPIVGATLGGLSYSLICLKNIDGKTLLTSKSSFNQLFSNPNK